MSKKRTRRNRRPLTIEEKSRMRRARDEVEAEKDDIRRRGREAFAAHEQALAGTIHELRQLRESMGLSLQEVAERMGTDRANLYRLENVPGNPTVATLARYAKAVGKRIVISVANEAG